MAGTYTNISVVAPDSAVAGTLITVIAKVYNKSTKLYVAVTGVYDSTTITFVPSYVLTDYGATASFSGGFTMPSKKVRVYVYSWVWDTYAGKWVLDDTAYKDIAVTAVAEPSFRNFKVLDYAKA